MMRPSTRIWAACAVVAMTAACGSGSSPAPGTPAKAGTAAATAEAPAIDVVKVVEQPLHTTLSLPGELQPFQSVAVYPRVTGFVRTVRVDRGSRVHAGDVMAELEAPELVAQRAEAQSKVQAAEAQLATARSKAESDAGTFDRLKAASATPGVVAGNDVVVAQKAVEGAQGQVTAAAQTVEASRQALAAVREMESYLRVVAPFDGVVTERNVHPGALVGPPTSTATTPMLRVVAQDRLRLVVPVPEALSGSVATGAMVTFSVAAYPGQTFTGTVARAARAVDVSTRTMAVELDVSNASGRLAPGTFSQVQWPVSRPTPSLFVPSSSVASTTDRTFVVRVRGGKAEWVDVKTGLAAGALVEVFGDLQAGDEVARRGTDEVRAGSDVRVKPAAAS
jgi:membrane fusion protein (multidrug efflux system)